MKLRSFLSTCSATICTTTDDTTTLHPPTRSPHHTPNRLFSDTSSLISDTTSPSLDSNLSLPSIPSLQKLSPDSLNLSLSHRYVTSLHPFPANHVTFLALNNTYTLLYAASGNLIHVFDTTSYTLLDTFSLKNSSSGTVKSITFSNGNVFTSHQDSKIRVWKLTDNNTHKHISSLPTREDRFLRSLFKRNYVNVRRHRKRLWIQHHDAVSGLAIINDVLMCSVSWDKYLKIWNTSSLRCVESIKAHDDAINAVVVAHDGTVYTGSADRRIKVWGKHVGEMKHYVLIATLEKHKSAVNALALNNDGSVLFSGACDRSILVWEKEDSAGYMTVTGALRGHSKAILCLVMVNVSDLLLSGSADRTVRIWKRGVVGKFCCLGVLDGHKQPVRSLVADVDSKATESKTVSTIKVFSGSFEGEIKIWKVEVFKLDTPMSTLLQIKL